ncbi:hypothetical protein [Nocardiopsis halotolerans]|uniref:hypothetical protein n=1 Tax=Nocardiopsis halotolerans TaxID=124252 RepID=UPI00034D2CB2|nr:hypothetical protein [Nocardiopsis halotolerans]
MYFHPPTLDPGPLATLIGLALLVFLIIQPLATRPLVRRLGEPVEPGRPTRRTRLFHVGMALSLVELLGAAVFVATARVVTPSDLNLILLRTQEYGSSARPLLAGNLVAWTGTVAALTGAVMFVAALVLEKRRSGAASSATEPAGPPVLTDAERRWAVWSFTLGGLSTTVVLFVVVYPMVTVFAGPAPAIAAIALAFGWHQWESGHSQMLVMAMYGLLLALSHAQLFSGSLFVPLAAWCLVSYLYARQLTMLRDRLRQQPGQYTPWKPMLQVTMLDADGNPVPRRHR